MQWTTIVWLGFPNLDGGISKVRSNDIVAIVERGSGEEKWCDLHLTSGAILPIAATSSSQVEKFMLEEYNKADKRKRES